MHRLHTVKVTYATCYAIYTHIYYNHPAFIFYMLFRVYTLHTILYTSAVHYVMYICSRLLYIQLPCTVSLWLIHTWRVLFFPHLQWQFAKEIPLLHYLWYLGSVLVERTLSICRPKEPWTLISLNSCLTSQSPHHRHSECMMLSQAQSSYDMGTSSAWWCFLVSGGGHLLLAREEAGLSCPRTLSSLVNAGPLLSYRIFSAVYCPR